MGQLVILTSCLNSVKEEKPLGVMYFEYFDTVSNIYSYAGDGQEEFTKNTSLVAEKLEYYHQLFDIYHEYSGVNNLCTINKYAGTDPIKVDEEMIEFLLFCKEMYNITNGETNIMLGSVLKIWHDARTYSISNPSEAYIPDMIELEEAALHTSIDLLEIDEVNNTVRISDPLARIDVGAIGKGYATEKAAQLLEDMKCFGYVLNIGGNIRTIGTKTNGEGWRTGIKNPANTSQYAFYTVLSDTSCVTSGNYERYYYVENVRYHHIIDKDTLMPAEHYASITVITKNSGMADSLSTALFCMDFQTGYNLVNSLENVEVLWIFNDGTQKKTENLISIEI